jgi:hypothetical protein
LDHTTGAAAKTINERPPSEAGEIGAIPACPAADGDESKNDPEGDLEKCEGGHGSDNQDEGIDTPSMEAGDVDPAPKQDCDELGHENDKHQELGGHREAKLGRGLKRSWCRPS